MNPSKALRSFLSAFRWTLEHRLPRTALLLALVVLLPAAFHAFAWFHHAINYTGTCGPHAPDIAAHPCTQEEYDSEFNAGFEGMALMMAEVMLAFAVLVIGFIAWNVIDHRVCQRRRNLEPA